MDKFLEFIKNNIAYIIVGIIILLVVIIVIAVLSAKKKKAVNAKEIAAKDLETKAIAARDEELRTVSAAKANSKAQKIADEPIAVKEEPIKTEKEEPVAVRSRVATGKWQIKRKSETDFYLYLVASNGEIMLSSEAYTSEDGAKNGIETVKKNALARNFQVYCDKNSKYYFKLKTSNNRLLRVGEVYSSKASCLSGIDSLVRFCETAVVSNEILEELTEMFYVPSGEVIPAKEGYSGKWIIQPIEDMYMAMLYASNGEVLVAGESYTTQDAAKKSIDNIIKNALLYNFIIDRNKNNKYYFKLRNINRNVICVGETYDNKASCVSAVDSVIRFCNTAKREY